MTSEEYTRRLSNDQRPGTIVVMSPDNKIYLGFPFLDTKFTTPFLIKEVLEWNHVENREAQIKGGGHKLFALNFYATDYILNAEKYKSKKEITVNLAGLAYVLDKADDSHENFSKDFTGYIPNQEDISLYDFIGEALEVTKVNKPNISGYIVKVALVKSQNNNEILFAPELFINEENMRIESIKKGDRITGAFWLHGCIAK